MAEAANTEAQQNFQIQRVFLKDVSFEAPNSPDVFQKEWNPDVKLDLDTQSRELAEGVYETIGVHSGYGGLHKDGTKE